MPILVLIAMGLLRRKRDRAKLGSRMKHDDYNSTHNAHNGALRREDASHGDDDVRAERLREEVKRYEQDLRELADA